MALLDWNPKMELGVEEMDRQHRQLVKILNELHTAMLAGGKHHDLARVMGELVQYTKYHFATEERLMGEMQYPGRLEHAREHRTLTAQAEEYAAEVLKGRATVSLRILQFLKEWLNGHILGSDRQFADYVKGRKAA